MARDRIYFMFCAGDDSARWKNYLGVPKQFIQIDGERILNRAVRLIREYDPEAKVCIVSKTDKFKVDDADLLIVPAKDEHNFCMWRYLQVYDKWQGETVFVYGDVWYSEEAIKKIVSYEGEFQYFGRPGPSIITKKPYQEPFAIYVRKSYAETLRKQILATMQLFYDKKIKECTDWELYCYINNKPFIRPCEVDVGFTTIDDFTEDFDRPVDYDLWLK